MIRTRVLFVNLQRIRRGPGLVQPLAEVESAPWAIGQQARSRDGVITESVADGVDGGRQAILPIGAVEEGQLLRVSQIDGRQSHQPASPPPCWPKRRCKVASDRAARSPIRWTPKSRSACWTFGPTPHSRLTGSGARNSASPPGGTTTRASGLRRSDATFAHSLLVATP